MEVKDYVERIIDNSNIEDMHKLSKMLEETMERLKMYDEDFFKKKEMELYKMAYGSNLNKNMAEKIVSSMKPYGQKWSLEQTSQIQQEYGINDIRDIDFYVVINSAYNDYKDLFNEDMEMYIKFTIDFIKDEDAKIEKVFLYYTEIPQ